MQSLPRLVLTWWLAAAKEEWLPSPEPLVVQTLEYGKSGAHSKMSKIWGTPMTAKAFHIMGEKLEGENFWFKSSSFFWEVGVFSYQTVSVKTNFSLLWSRIFNLKKSFSLTFLISEIFRLVAFFSLLMINVLNDSQNKIFTIFSILNCQNKLFQPFVLGGTPKQKQKTKKPIPTYTHTHTPTYSHTHTHTECTQIAGT